MLNVQTLSARYGRLEVCRNISFEALGGRVTVLVGPNGAGKSSTLGAIAGSVSSKGKVQVDGLSLSQDSAAIRARRGVSLVPEGRRNVFGGLSVEDNLLLGSRLLPQPSRPAMLDALMQTFPVLKSRLRQHASMLSGGEQQLLAIAVAIARKPKVLLLDEPSQGLAPVALDGLVRCIDGLRSSSLAIVLAEQNYSFATQLADAFVALRGGQVVKVGTGDELADPSLAEDLVMGR